MPECRQFSWLGKKRTYALNVIILVSGYFFIHILVIVFFHTLLSHSVVDFCIKRQSNLPLVKSNLPLARDSTYM